MQSLDNDAELEDVDDDEDVEEEVKIGIEE
jgi:hypothetical protein